jgi:hypothetical protein
MQELQTRARVERRKARAARRAVDVVVGHGSRSHNAATALMSAPTARARYSGRRSTAERARYSMI